MPEEYNDGVTRVVSPSLKKKNPFSTLEDKPAVVLVPMTIEQKTIWEIREKDRVADPKMNVLKDYQLEDISAAAVIEAKKQLRIQQEFEKHSEWQFKSMVKKDSTKIIIFQDKAEPDNVHIMLAGGVHKSYIHFESRGEKFKALEKINRAFGVTVRRRKNRGWDVYIPKK